MNSEIPGLSQSANQYSPCYLQGEPITSTNKINIIPSHVSSLETLKSAIPSVQLNCGGIYDDPVNINIVNNKPEIVQDLFIGDNKDKNVNVLEKTLKTVRNVNKKLSRSNVSKQTFTSET